MIRSESFALNAVQFLIIFQIPVFVASKYLTAVIGEPVELPCNFDENGNRNNLRIIMQKDTSKVVHSFDSGKDDLIYQDVQFKNRTKIVWPRIAIKLSKVDPKDKGSYTCHIQEKKDSEYLSGPSFDSELNVIGLYRKPTITRGNKDQVHYGAEVNLTCSSSNGYPEATVEWINETENVTLNGALTNFDCDPVNHLCNFTSVLTVTVTTELTMICSVINPGLQDNRTLNQIILTPVHPGNNNKIGLVIVLVAIAVMLAVIFLLIIISRSRSIRSEEESYTTFMNRVTSPRVVSQSA